MTNSVYSAPGNEQTLMDTDLNSLANVTVNVGGTAIDNSTNRYLYVELELVLASVDLSSQTNPAVDVYLVPSYDGTNYADTGTDGSTTDLPLSDYLVASMGVSETSAAHLAVSPHILLDPVKYTPVVVNSTGAALAATGNTLKCKTYTVTT